MSPGTSPGSRVPQPPSLGSSHSNASTPRAADASSHTATGSTEAAPSTAPISRRTHAKSRTGCRICKRRKIKCDEQRPSCRNCIKHAVTCDFVHGQTPSHVPDGVPANSSLGLDGAESTHPRYQVPGALNMVDLELIHNFTTFTHATISSEPAMRQMLKTTAIRMAFDCEFLMRTILALSAVHLAHFRRDRHDFYVRVAMDHHQVACRLAVSVMDHPDNLTQADCENLHLFSVMTLFYALGSPKTETPLVVGDSMIPSWLTMLRSAEPILRVLDPESYNGRLAPLFAFGRGRWRVLYGGDHQRPSGDSLLMDLESSVNRGCKEPDLLPIYQKVIDNLRRVFSMLALDGDTATAHAPKLEAWDIFIFVWHWGAAKDFIPLLRGNEPRQEAVAIYAHFLIMLRKLENQWWLEGWARYMMERVWTALDEEHRLWIQWPIEELGWLPP